jgi:hypothetical protein
MNIAKVAGAIPAICTLSNTVLFIIRLTCPFQTTRGEGEMSASYNVFYMRVVLYTNNASRKVHKKCPVCILICLPVGIFHFVKYVIVFDEIWV